MQAGSGVTFTGYEPKNLPIATRNLFLHFIFANYLTPRIPTLDINNSAPWHLAFEYQPQALGIAHHIRNPGYLPDAFQHCAEAALTSAIITSLPTSV